MVGQVAKRQAITNPDRTISSIKREMGSDYKVTIDGKQLYSAGDHRNDPAKAEGAMLRLIWASPSPKQSSRFLPTSPMLSVRPPRTPARSPVWKSSVSSTNPPLPLWLMAWIRKKTRRSWSMTWAAALSTCPSWRSATASLKCLATAGNNRLGGDDFDKCIMDYLAAEFKKENGIDLTTDKVAMQRLKEAAEKAKIELSGVTTSNINLPYITADATGPKHLDVTLTRAKFNELTNHLVEATMGPVRQALSDAGLKPCDLAQGSAGRRFLPYPRCSGSC